MLLLTRTLTHARTYALTSSRSRAAVPLPLKKPFRRAAAVLVMSACSPALRLSASQKRLLRAPCSVYFWSREEERARGRERDIETATRPRKSAIEVTQRRKQRGG